MAKKERDGTEHGMPEPVQGYRAWAIYADYDANAPDTEDLILVSTEALAEAVCLELNEDTRRWNNLAFVDGFEWAKSFSYHEVLVADPYAPRRSLAEVFEKDVEEDEDYEPEDGG